MSSYYGSDRAWELQPDAVISQANPGSGTQYPVLAAQEAPVRIYAAITSVTWTVQPTPLELHGIFETRAYPMTRGNPVSGTDYFMSKNEAAEGFWLGTDITVMNRAAFLVDIRNMGGIVGEVTGGTVQNLDVRIKWALKL